MKLIMSLTSPFARKVRVVLAEKRIDYESVVDSPWDATTQVPEYNPLGKVPVLVMDDGSTLFDSRVIVEYLDNLTPVSPLLPKENRPRIAVRRWEALADGVTESAATIYLEKKRPETRQDPEWIVRQESQVFRGLEALSEELGEKTWCTGDFFSLADIAVGCTLGYLDFRFPYIQWREAHPNLGKLAEKLAQRSSFKDSVPVA
ncbi:MAG: glutathione S-transferase [Sulfurimicrobium sp.]|jgi:glutathione S-transferase|nr:glutathione S-transferase [Sulfurimicrobium sp.]MDP1704145.1 glutathione S-transferase [Sulfurimicrobium sp.]MDP2199458.1 glutathione S-transferase [Sulfurimicrobium sp.]MDP2962100.1 glutathione S-transferase [Sulfurimicrobium sp.]MDP3688461.1 glutathione S-transferase [Sulfurimicrobium sp.]